VNANIRRLAIVFTIIFGLISLDLVYYQVIDAGTLDNTASAGSDCPSSAACFHNPRILLQEQDVIRGGFYDRNGTILVGRWRKPDGFVQTIYKDWSLAQTIGYHSITYGDSGLQASLNSYLVGQSGTSWSQTFNSWLHRPVTGDDVYLTIDDKVQQAAVSAIQSSLAENGLSPNTPAAAVAFNPTTGQILAMVSKPYFDPTCLDSESHAAEYACYQRIEAIPGVPNVQASPLVNRVTDGLFPPGSTFKTVTLAGGLDTGDVSLSDEFSGSQATGPYTIDGYTLTNATSNLPPGRTAASLLQAFMWSDNIVYAQVGLKLGWSTLLRYANGFRLGQPIPFDIPVSPSSILAPGEKHDDITLATSAFGQGHDQVTPMQMMLIAGAIADGGKLALPTLVKAIKTPEGTVVKSDSPSIHDTSISASTAAKVRYAMEQVVSGYYGSGYEAAIPGILVAGKTGTAQTGNPNQLDTWFISFAPADHPTVAVAVVVQAPSYCPGLGAAYTDSTCEGAYISAPIARQIMETAIQDGD